MSTLHVIIVATRRLAHRRKAEEVARAQAKRRSGQTGEHPQQATPNPTRRR